MLVINKKNLLQNNVESTSLRSDDIDLKYIAYENIHQPVFHLWLKKNTDERNQALLDRYVFFSCACCVGPHISNLLKNDFNSANEFATNFINNINYVLDSNIPYTEEWYKGLDRLAKDLTSQSFIKEARCIVAIALRTGVKKYPRIAQSINVQTAYLDALTGKYEKAGKGALELVQRPYLLPNRKELADVCLRLMHILAASNHLREYKLVAWTGVNIIQASDTVRDAFAAQLSQTYRGMFRALIRGDVPIKYRIPLILANLAHIVFKIPPLRYFGLDKPIRWLHRGYLCFSEKFLFKRYELFMSTNNSNKEAKRRECRKTLTERLNKNNKKILITRAMGGIGDILMMTPGLVALSKKYKKYQIHFAVPKAFHPVLDGLPGVQVLDIDTDQIDLSSYKKWINLTDCPAGKIESRQSPNVRRNRIEIFAKTMGISKWSLRFGTGFVPFYKVNDDEVKWAENKISQLNPENLPIIGIQPFSADSYKNWPYMEQLALELSENNCVLIFHGTELNGFNANNIHKIVEPIRKSIALAMMCKKLVVVDSSFNHISAPLGIEAISIFGPTSGKLFTKYYKNVEFVAPIKSEYPCYPCWRNEHKPCHLTKSRESLCLKSISLSSVQAKLKRLPIKKKKIYISIDKTISWIKYGTE